MLRVYLYIGHCAVILVTQKMIQFHPSILPQGRGNHGGAGSDRLQLGQLHYYSTSRISHLPMVLSEMLTLKVDS